MDNIMQFAVVGAIVSLLVQWLKQYTFGGWRTQVILIVLSFIGGAAYLFFQAHTNYWLDVVKVLGVADVAYSFILQYFEKSTPTQPGA